MHTLKNYGKDGYKGKSPIFSKRMIEPHRKPSHADSPADALAISMQEVGRVELDYMKGLTGRTEEGLVKALEFDRIYFDFQNYTNRIQDAENLLVKIQADIETVKKNTVVDENGQEKFSIILNGKTFTDKKEASTFIAEFLKKNSNSRSPLHGLSGEYKGLHISTAFEPPFLHEELILDGQVSSRKNSSAVPGDNINRIIEMANWRTKYAQDKQNEIENLRDKIATAKVELQTPFPLQEEFDQLSLRSAELTHLLNEDANSAERDKENLLSEKQRRMQAIFDSQPDSLCEKYFFTFARKNLNSSADDWSTTLDEKAISFLFDEGFSKDMISETILKSSPAVPSKEDVFHMVLIDD